MKLKIYLSKTLFLLSNLTCLILFISSAYGQGNNSISGFVFGIDRQPISQIQVELLDDFNRFVSRARTEGSGRYNFFRLPQGRYSVRVLALGTNYEEQTKEVEIVNIIRQSSTPGSVIISGSENKQLDFYLRLNRRSDNLQKINGVVFAQDVPKTAQKYYDNALSDFDKKRSDQGIEKLKAALEIFPDYYLALERLGQEYVNQQKYEEARDIFVTAVRVNPKSFESYYALGFSLHKLKNYTEAIEAIKKSLEINNSSVNSLFLLGVNLKQIGKYTEAVDSLEKAKKLATTPAPEIHWQLALIYTNNLKKYDTAANELELFLKASPKYEEAEKVKELIKKLRTKTT